MKANDYKIIPDEDELTAVKRDLSFHASTGTNPKFLSPRQVEDFNRDGFVRPVPIYGKSEIDSIRAYFDQLLEKVTTEGGNSYSISSAHLKYGPVWDILTEPRIVRVVKDILGENVIGWGSHFFCKMSGDGKRVAWHQDSSYWPLTPSKAITVWLAVDDADTDNACMRFIRSSHWKGHLT